MHVCARACVCTRGHQERLPSRVPCGVTDGGTGFLAVPSVSMSGSTSVQAGPQASEPPLPPAVTSLTTPRHLAASTA